MPSGGPVPNVGISETVTVAVKRSPRRPTLQTGFTLVEVGITLAVLVVLVTMAVPSFADYLAQHRLNATAEKLQLDMMQARYNAVQQGSPMHLGFSTGSDWCWAVAKTPGCDCHGAQRCQLKTLSSGEAKGIRLVSASDAFFLADGTGQGSAELHTARGQVLRVEVSPLGRSRICSPGSAQMHQPMC